MTIQSASIGLCLALALSFTSCSAQTGDTSRKVLLKAAGFAADLAGWSHRGEAEFAVDPAQSHGGMLAARIVIAPGGKLEYQQIYRDFSDDVKPGDQMEASVRVRTMDVDAAPGAYMALEFLDSGGQRVGIAHSITGQSVGAKDWQTLTAAGEAPDGTVRARLSLILHAHGTAWFLAPQLVRTGRAEPWPGLGDALRRARIDRRSVALGHFGGVGFHAFQQTFPATQEEMDTVIYKRWRELNPRFARLNDEWDYDRARLDRMAEHIARMKQTGTEVYITTWNPPDVKTPGELAAWARKVADNLEYLIRTKGLTNIRWYCMTNELSLGGWGKLANDMPRFKQYHEALYAELKRRSLPVGLLATDASPIEYWHTIEWAAQNVDDVTAIYGGHHYINDRTPEDERLYPWFLGKLSWATGIARAKGKDFILGEFGSKQDGRTIDGKRMDVCIWYGTPREAQVGLQLGDAVIAAVNAGVYAMGYWTFMDLPDDFAKGYLNKWGLFKNSGTDRSTRTVYYAYALLTRYLRGPASVYRVECSDPRLRIAAIRKAGSGAWSIAIVNRNPSTVKLELDLGDRHEQGRFRKYVYDPAHVALNPFGDLPGPDGVVTAAQGKLSDTVAPATLTVYTTDYRDTRPAAVGGVFVSRSSEGVLVQWRPSRASDICYYRVNRLGAGGARTQVGSTVACQFLDRGAPEGEVRYHIVAVDMSGNAGP